MGNRHGHKQLRIAVRARMARTGESYQKARARILALHEGRPPTATSPSATAIGVDLLPIRYYGRPAALATFEIAGRLAMLFISSPECAGPLPLNPLLALGSRCGVQ